MSIQTYWKASAGSFKSSRRFRGAGREMLANALYPIHRLLPTPPFHFLVYLPAMPNTRRTPELRFPGLREACISSRVAGDVIPASGETGIDIVTTSCVKRAGIALSGELNIIRSSVDGGFLAYYLNSKKKLAIASLAQGSSVKHLYATQLEQLTLSLPPLAEQRRISAFLGALDVRVAGVKRALERVGDFKRGVADKMLKIN